MELARLIYFLKFYLEGTNWIEKIDFPRSRSWSGPKALLASSHRDLSIRGVETKDVSRLPRDDALLVVAVGQKV